MIKRTLSTVVLWLAIGGLLVFFGAPAAILLLILLAAATQHELYGMLEKTGYRPCRKSGIALGALYLAGAWFLRDAPVLAPFYETGFDGLALGLIVIGILVVLLGSQAKDVRADRIGALISTAAGFVYVPFLLHYFIRIVQEAPAETTGLILAFWVVVLVKFADIGAYLTGSFIGRTKLAPSLSPGKTWEGACGGIIISALVSAGYIGFFYGTENFPVALTPLAAGLVAVPIAAVSIVSDLLESAFKRSADVKDSGRTIPGIGGAFDLTDSLILSVPVAYVFLLCLTATTGT